MSLEHFAIAISQKSLMVRKIQYVLAKTGEKHAKTKRVHFWKKIQKIDLNVSHGSFGALMYELN